MEYVKLFCFPESKTTEKFIFAGHASFTFFSFPLLVLTATLYSNQYNVLQYAGNRVWCSYIFQQEKGTFSLLRAEGAIETLWLATCQLE